MNTSRRLLLALPLLAATPATAQPADVDPRCERPLASPADPRIVTSQSLTASPPDPPAYFRQRAQAVRLRVEGRLAEAVPIAESLVRQYACDAYLWRLLGDARYQAGRPAEAVAAYQRALDIGGPGTPSGVGYRLAASHAAAGNREAALQMLERLVFEHRYLLRPNLYDFAEFASLRDDPRFQRIVGRPDMPGGDRNAGWVRDLDHLVAEVKRTNPVYSRLPLPAEFTAMEAALRRDIPRLSDEQVYAGMARLIASLGQGHTGMAHFYPSPRMPFSALPLQLHAFAEGLFVVSAKEGARGLVGARLVAIENVPALEVLRRVSEVHTHESGMEALWTGPSLVGIAQLLKGLGIAPRTDRIGATFQLRSGETIRRELVTVPIEGRPKLVPPPDVAPPLFLRNVGEFHWSERIGEDILYVQLNQVQPEPGGESLADFGLGLRRQLAERPVRHLILDLRHNNGGNTYLYPELLRTLIAFTTEERNRLYVLIGRWTYSAAANLATDLQRLARPIFVGEPTSQTGNQFGDSATALLPYSGLGANLTGVQWQLSDPWDQRPVITPHVPVQLTAEAYFAGRDPALEAIRSLIASGAVPPGEMDPR